MAKEHYSLLKKMATVLGLFAIAIFIIGAASSNDNRNDGDALIEAAPPDAVTTTATTTTEKTAAKPVIPAVETFSYDCINETVTVEGKSLPVEIVDKTFQGEEEPISFTAKAVVNGKTVLLNGKIPSTILEPIVCGFKYKSGVQITKLPDGCFVSATIE